MRQVDEDYAGNILANPEAASFLQQIAQSDPDNALVSTDGKVTGFFEASDHDYGTFDAYKWQLWDVENGWYPGGVEDPNLLSQTFKDPQNILMLGKGEAYYSFDNLYQQVSGESASKANTQNLMILGSTAGSLGAIRLAGLARTETGLLLSNPTSYFYSQGYKLTLMADEAVAGLAGFPTGVVFGGGGAMLLDNMASGGGRYAAALLDDASSLGAFGRGVDSNPGQFRFFEVPDNVAPEVPTYEAPFNPLTKTQRADLKAKLDSRTITKEEYQRLEWDRRFANRRATGVRRFWAEERASLRAGESGTRNWTAEQREAILAGKRPQYNGETIQGHHKYNALDHPQIANDPNNIYPATKTEHFERWHGGNWRNDTFGEPVNPLFLEEF